MSATKSPALKRVFLGFTDTCGYLVRLRQGFAELGIKADIWDLEEHPFQYRNQRPLLSRLFLRLAIWAVAVEGPFWIPARAVLLAAKALLLMYSLFAYDLFVFSFGSSFFRMREFPLLKWSGKKIILLYFGSDSRPPYLSGIHGDEEPERTRKIARALHSSIRRGERHADYLINHTATSHFHTRPVVRYLAIGIPTVPEAPLAPTTREGKGFKIVHAPSRPLQKGSKFFQEAVEALRSEGFAIDFVQIVGQPNDVVLKELQSCDLVLDELYSDSPMATFALEAACFGKPTLVGGYYSDLVQGDNAGALPPSCYCRPEQVLDKLRRLVKDEITRTELGLQAQAFVSEHWNFVKVAERYVRLYQGEAPAEWFFDPANLRYAHGWGIEETRLSKALRRYLEKFGTGALFLDDKQELNRLVSELASKHPD